MDLKAAGINYKDERGRVFDFHALRGAYISRIERTGATVKTLQTLARHTDPKLTLKRYARLHQDDQVAAVESMPDLVPVTRKVSWKPPKNEHQHIRQHSVHESLPNDAKGCDDDKGHKGKSKKYNTQSPKGISVRKRRSARCCEKRPLGESNPCFQDENLASWATRRRGPVRRNFNSVLA